MGWDLQQAAADSLACKRLVFVNMVKPDLGHFLEVAAASKVLAAQGLAPVPHVPVSRFGTSAEFRSVLGMLSAAGARHLLVVGGNDLAERREAGRCAYSSTGMLLEEEAEAIRQHGICSVALAGHPDGNPACGGSPAASRAALLERVHVLLRSGLDVAITTQFTFNPWHLAAWLQRVCSAAEGLAGPGGPQVSFRVGVPGPTPLRRLGRIAAVCGVPTEHFPSAFERGGGGRRARALSLQALEAMACRLGMFHSGTRLRDLHARHARTDGTLGPVEFARMLVEDACAAGLEEPADTQVIAPMDGGSGPSRFVAEGGCSQGSQVAWPHEAVLALAAICEQKRELQGKVALHVYPFGGIARARELEEALRSGPWPA